MLEAWRIVKTKYLDQAFSGESASDYGGRWNSPGTRLIYTASSASLALLEVLVHHKHSPALPAYSLIRIRFPGNIVLTLDQSSLPENWRSHPSPGETQRIGDEWVFQEESAILAVPSVIVPHELNYVINPEHEDFGEIQIDDPLSFPIDERLLGKTP
jgi:RES domain-containing protein